MNRSILIIGVIFLFILSALAPMSTGYNAKKSKVIEPQSTPLDNGGLMNSSWPMFQYDVRHTGRSPFGKSGNWFKEKWKVGIGDWAYSSPSIDSNYTIYVGGGIEDKSLHAIYSNGTKKWSFKTNAHVKSSPAIAEDGTIYVGSTDGNLYAINPIGTLKWKLGIGSGWAFSSPVIDKNGIIYMGEVLGKICAVYPNGTKKWTFNSNGDIYCHPSLDENGTVYIGSSKDMYAIYTNNGTLKWKYRTGGGIGSAPTIDNKGIIYFGSNDGYLYALYPNGTRKWRFLTKPNFGLTSSPAITENGNIVVGSGEGYVYSINPDNGAMNWKFNAGDQVSASPAIDKYGIIYVGAWNGWFYVLNPDGTLRWRYKALDEIFPSVAIGEDGIIYFGAHSFYYEAYLYAIEPFEDNAPDKPNIDGPASGKPLTEYTYTAVTDDFDGDNVSYFFDWGDDTNSGWTEFVPSGSSRSRSHRWLFSGTYTIKVKAKDDYGLEGDWGTFTVIMPRDKATTNSLFLRFLERYPLLNRLLSFTRMMD